MRILEHSARTILRKIYKLMNNAIFDKIMENVRNHATRDAKGRQIRRESIDCKIKFPQSKRLFGEAVCNKNE